MAKPKKSQNEKKKQKALESLERILKQRKISALAVPFSFILSQFVSRSYPEYTLMANLMSITMTFLVCSIFPLAYFIRQKKETLSADKIYFIIAINFAMELILIVFLFYLIAPIIIHHFGNILFLITPVIIIYNITSNPIFNNKKYSIFFFLFGCFLLIDFSLIEYFNLYLLNDFGFPIKPNKPEIVVITLLINLFGFLVIQFYIENFWEMFRKQAGELETLNEELEQRVRERTSELEEAKSILEIKVKARTNELEELTKSLEGKVQGRTQELQEKTQELQKRVNELEKFHKLTVGRELKMVELKKDIEELKKEKESE